MINRKMLLACRTPTKGIQTVASVSEFSLKSINLEIKPSQAVKKELKPWGGKLQHEEVLCEQ